MPLRGLLVDYGGVLTTDVFASFAQFSSREGLAPQTVRDRFREDPAARALLGELECGQTTEPEFERRFGALLGVDPHDLIERLFAGIDPDVEMLAEVRSAKTA